MTRTVTDRLAELRDTFEERRNERIRAEFTDHVAQLHDSDPTCIRDDAANRVLRFLRSQPIVGKHLIYSSGPDGPWRLGRVTPRAPGNFTLESATFERLEDAMRAVFDARRQAYLDSCRPQSAGGRRTNESASDV
ncbi:hypothetical protein ASG82_07660 [Mycobacterium sp. Soil538]|nr:hypothetical protein ASG82_07660 [Mycobacterium sp. Soil538]